MVIVADGSTEHFGVPCCSLWRVDEAWLGVDGFDRTRLGAARRGNSCRRQHGGRKPSLLLSWEGGHGQVNFGPAC
jgi:hypothetical protein